MINYVEKGIGLHEEIRAAGHTLRQHDGEWISSDDAAVQTIIDNYTLEKVKTQMQLIVREVARARFDKITSGISAAEMAAWPLIVQEVRQYRANGTEGPLISAEATERGVTVSTLVDRIETKLQQYQTMRAKIAGISGKKRDAIAALATFAEVLSFNVEEGWPV